MVFSQFTSFLDLIQAVLARDGLPWYRFDGSMDVRKRNEAVAGFKAPSREPKVLIISLKAGGVGLNVGCSSNRCDGPLLTCLWCPQLTNANHVFMVSLCTKPPCNPS